MSSRLPNLIWLRSFEAAARLLNFTKAGQELGLTQTAVSLHIKALEETLGCGLFHRNPRRLELTDMGQAYAHSVRKGLGDLNLATVSLFGSKAKQTITVRAPVSTATLWLAPLLPDFARQHPGITIRLISTIWAASIADDDVDVDLRIGFGDWPGMQVEKLSDETIVPICARSMAARLRTPGDLLGGPLVQILGYEDNWDRYLLANGLNADLAVMRYSVDTTIAAFGLVTGGKCHAVIMTRFAESAICTGYPVAMIGTPVDFPQSHYLTSSLTHAAPRAEVELFKSWLRAKFAEPAGDAKLG